MVHHGWTMVLGLLMTGSTRTDEVDTPLTLYQDW